jgi:hypothetical protein
MRHYTAWQQPNCLRDYINKLDDQRLYSVGYQRRSSPIVQYRPAQSSILIKQYRCTNRERCSVSNLSRQDSSSVPNAPGQQLPLLESVEKHQ